MSKNKNNKEEKVKNNKHNNVEVVDDEKYSLYQILDILKIQESYKRYYINLYKNKKPMAKSEWKLLIK